MNNNFKLYNKYTKCIKQKLISSDNRLIKLIFNNFNFATFNIRTGKKVTVCQMRSIPFFYCKVCPHFLLFSKSYFSNVNTTVTWIYPLSFYLKIKNKWNSLLVTKHIKKYIMLNIFSVVSWKKCTDARNIFYWIYVLGVIERNACRCILLNLIIRWLVVLCLFKYSCSLFRIHFINYK